VSEEDRAALTRVLILMKSNLISACERPVDETPLARKVSHG
jgi:hypothetical protein